MSLASAFLLSDILIETGIFFLSLCRIGLGGLVFTFGLFV